MKSLFTILLLGLFISSQAQNISQSQVRQFNAVPAYRVFGRGAGVGTPSFITLDSNHVPQLHSQSYYDLRYGSLSVQNTNTSNISAKWDINGNALVAGVSFLGSTNNTSVHFKTNNTEQGLLDSLGYVGFGDFRTTRPVSHVHIIDNGSFTGRGIMLEQNTTNSLATGVNFRKTRGSYNSPSAIVNGDFIGGTGYYGYTGGQYLSGVVVGSVVAGTVSGSSIPMDYYIAASPTGTLSGFADNTVKFILKSDGKVGIGDMNINPTERLHVKGKVRIDTLPTGAATDSLITVSNGVLGKIAQSSTSSTSSSPSSNSAQIALTDAPTIVWDFSLGNRARVTLNGNRVLSVTNANDGDIGILDVYQDATGSRTLTLPGQSETGKSMSIAANAKDKLTFEKVTTSYDWTINNFGPQTGTITANTLTFATNTNLVNTSGVWTTTNATTGYGNTGLETVYTLPANGAVRFKRATTADGNAVLGLKTTNAAGGFAGFIAAILLSPSTGDIVSTVNGTVSPPLGTAAVNDLIELRRTGSAFQIRKSSDSGVTWTNVGSALTSTSSATLYVVCDLYGGGTAKMTNPQITN